MRLNILSLKNCFRLSKQPRLPIRELNEHELRFCIENKIDTNLARGEPFDNSPMKTRVDPIWIAGKFKDGPIISQLDAVVINTNAKFGNAMIKLSNSFKFALTYSISTIYQPGFEFLDDEATYRGIRILKGTPSDGNYLRCDFYYNKTLAGLTKDISRYEAIKHLCNIFNFDTSKASTVNELYIHIRSGDIFRCSVPHYMYGQPPLAFYKKILNYQDWDQVHLVYEDDSNPIIKPLVAFLEHKKIAYHTHSSGLISDIESLFKAQNLMIGRGTFIYPILCLSKNIKKVFAFEGHSKSWGLDKSDIEFIQVFDKTGIYKEDILKNWKNSADQIKLMLNYEEHNLTEPNTKQ